MSAIGSLEVADVIPGYLSGIFPFKSFNAMQTIVARQLLETDANIVVAAPTGSGKTVLHELAIVRLLITASLRPNKLKAVVIAPNKALCQQRVAEWSATFGPVGLTVIELTGDNSLVNGLQSLTRSNIVVTTPEKWDAITRGWRKHMYLLRSIDLLLLDEVHHLGDSRGAVLETVVVRLRILNETITSTELCEGNNESPRMRIVALSATLPNIRDVGEWIRCSPEFVHYFDDSFRPVPLTMHVKAFPSWKNPFLFEKSLDEKVADVVRTYSDSKQTLIFCSSKKGAESLCLLLSRQIKISFMRDNRVSALSDLKLRALASVGMGYHHAGLPPDDRAIIESLFLNGSIQILCTTTTLAHGVNLPAHLVIVKGTNVWRGKGYEKLPRSTILQMVGRAGRPNFDTFGTAVIMTSDENREYYEVSQMDVVESALPSCLVEALCVEVTQGVIRDLADCLMWLKMTFFFIRVVQNKSYYGFSVESGENTANVVQSVCVGALNDLAEAHILNYDSESFALTPQREAFIMTRHVIKFKSMKNIMSMERTWSFSQLIRGMCFMEEAEKILRRDEKKLLNELMKSARFPLKVRVSTSDLKAYVLLQAFVSKTFVTDFALRMEQADIVEQLIRVLIALREHCIDRAKGKLLESAILLRRSLIFKLWENDCPNFFEQFHDISDRAKSSLVSHLSVADSTNSPMLYSDMACSDVFDIRRKYMCSDGDATAILHHTLEARQADFQITTSLNDGCTLCFTISVKDANLINFAEKSRRFDIVFIVYDVSTGDLLCYRSLQPLEKYEFSISIPIREQRDLQVSVINATVWGLDLAMVLHIENGQILDLSKQQGFKTDTSMNSVKVRSRIIKLPKKKQKRTMASAFTEGNGDNYNYKMMRKVLVSEEPTAEFDGIYEKENNFHNFHCPVDDKNFGIPRELKILRDKALEVNLTSKKSNYQQVPQSPPNVTQHLSLQFMAHRDDRFNPVTTDRYNFFDKPVSGHLFSGNDSKLQIRDIKDNSNCIDKLELNGRNSRFSFPYYGGRENNRDASFIQAYQDNIHFSRDRIEKLGKVDEMLKSEPLAMVSTHVDEVRTCVAQNYIAQSQKQLSDLTFGLIKNDARNNVSAGIRQISSSSCKDRASQFDEAFF